MSLDKVYESKSECYRKSFLIFFFSCSNVSVASKGHLEKTYKEHGNKSLISFFFSKPN